MHKGLLLKLFLLILLVSTSCGVKKKTSAPEYVKSALALESSCNINEVQNKFSNEIGFPQFYKRVRTLIDKYEKTHGESIIGLSSFYMEEGSHYKKPLILSKKKLKKKLNKLKSIFHEMFENDISEVESLRPMDVEPNRIEFTEFLQEVGKLNEGINRWEAQQCELDSLSEKRQSDLRALFKFREDEESFMDLCIQFLKKEFCEAEFNTFKRSGKKEEFVEHYKAKIEKAEKSFFQRNKNISLTCERDENLKKNIIELKIHINKEAKENLTELNKMKSVAELKWSNSNNRLKISFEDNKNLSARLKMTNRYVSHVQTKGSKRVLFLSTRMNRFQRPYIFAHEVGHLLGFPDCYVEFFDKKREEIVYYSLEKENVKNDQRNIMCGLHAQSKAPDQYVNQLEAEFCKN